MYSILIAVILTIASAIFIQNEKIDPEKIHGVYSQPGKWYYLKYFIFLVILYLRNVRIWILQEWRRNFVTVDKEKEVFIQKLECLQPLVGYEKAFDAVSFQAVTQNGYYLYGLAERIHGGKVNSFFYLVVPNIGILRSEHLPNTLLDIDPNSLWKNDRYSAKGISFVPVIPMKKWKVLFNGKMRSDSNELFHVKFDGEWTSDFPYFHYDIDLNSKSLARAIASEIWSKEFFDKILKLHQIHYEQMGELKGSLTIHGEEQKLKMKSFRSHIYGRIKDWSNIHRYVFHSIHLIDNSRISIWIRSCPVTLSHLESGYIIYPNRHISSIESCDLFLYHHGEKGEPPEDIGFIFMANGESYEVECTVDSSSFHFMGNNTEAKLIECFCKYKVNGMDGVGISEWHYNNLM